MDLFKLQAVKTRQTIVISTRYHIYLFFLENFHQCDSLVKSNIVVATKIPQVRRQNAVFVIGITKFKETDLVKSELNGVFEKSYEIKYKIFTAMKNNVVRIGKNKIHQNELIIRVHRTENANGLIRNYLYFQDDVQKVYANKLVLQYYLNKNICGGAHSISSRVSKHGNAKNGKQFYAVKKSTLIGLKSDLMNDRRKRTTKTNSKCHV